MPEERSEMATEADFADNYENSEAYREESEGSLNASRQNTPAEGIVTTHCVHIYTFNYGKEKRSDLPKNSCPPDLFMLLFQQFPSCSVVWFSKFHDLLSFRYWNNWICFQNQFCVQNRFTTISEIKCWQSASRSPRNSGKRFSAIQGRWTTKAVAVCFWWQCLWTYCSSTPTSSCHKPHPTQLWRSCAHLSIGESEQQLFAQKLNACWVSLRTTWQRLMLHLL